MAFSLITAAPHMQAPGPLAALAALLETDPDNKQLRVDLFERALEANTFDLAASIVHGALAADPTNAAWRHRLALLAMTQGQWPDACVVLQGLVDEGYAETGVRYNLAHALFVLHRFDAADTILGALMEEEPFSQPMPQALTLRIRCLHLNGRLDDGVALYQRCEMHSSAQAAGAAALLALDAGHLDLADAWTARALAQDANQHEALVARGSVLLGRHQTQEALVLLLRAEKGHPNDGRTLSALGLAHLLVFDFNAAHSALCHAVQSMPNHIGTWHALGWCEIFLSNFEAANEAFEQAITLDRNFGESYGGLAIVLALRNQEQLASKAIRQAEGLPGANLGARYAAAILSGEAQKLPHFVEQMARRILGERRDADGHSFADILLRP